MRKKYSEKDIDKVIHATDDLWVNPRDLTDYHMYKAEDDPAQNRYELERQYMELIELGKLEELKQARTAQTADSMISQMGTMARGNDFKQAEYMAVTSIAIMTRAAIRGGLPSKTAFELSDLYLQKVTRSKSELRFLQISDQAAMDFCQRVQELNANKRHGALIERVKDYVARKLYQPISVSQMAEELSYNRTYLSGKFAEQTGLTIQEYIRRERLHAAANLLIYSDRAIAQIAEILQFSSAGRFSGYFREQFGMSPSAYRQKNRVTEYFESR